MSACSWLGSLFFVRCEGIEILRILISSDDCYKTFITILICSYNAWIKHALYELIYKPFLDLSTLPYVEQIATHLRGVISLRETGNSNTDKSTVVWLNCKTYV